MGTPAPPSAVAPVQVTLDRERPLVFDFAALQRAELRFREVYREPDVSIFELVARFATQRKLGLTETSVLLWAALSIDDPALTPERVLRAITFENFAALTAACAVAIGRSFTPAEPAAGGGESSGCPFVPSPGSSSGPSPVTTSTSLAPSSGA
jgi:hypothetical protein